MARVAVVIGGGMVGTTSALALQRAGFAVTLCDPMRTASGASWGNAGQIAVEQVEPWASWPAIRSAPGRLFSRGGALSFPLRDTGAWLPFCLRLVVAASRFGAGKKALSGLLAHAGNAWRALVSDVGAPDLLRDIGHFVIWESAASAERGLATWRAADIGNASFRLATGDELTRIAGLMKRRPAGAIRFTGTGQIADPTRLAATLAHAFETRGGKRVYERVERLSQADADITLVAAGARSSQLIPAPLVAERGYHIQCAASAWPDDLGPLVFEDRSMIVTSFESGVRAASFLEFSRPDSPPDARKWERLRMHVGDIGLPLELPGKPWMGSRPTLPDYLPAIGRRDSKLLYAFGHHHLGLTLSAITAEIIAALAIGAPSPVPIEAFDLARFD
jgi:glycine/D-amino acid oxidase-like deaminating enzyme